MIKINWFGLISLKFRLTYYQYIFIFVNYFIKFTCAKIYLIYITDNIINIYDNHLLPIFNQSEATYIENKSYFINKKVMIYF